MTDQAEQKPAADDTAAANVAMASGDNGTQSAIPAEELTRLTDDIVGALKTVYDPEIPADIYELGLIYKIDIDDERNVDVEMTLTAPGCPVAGEMPIWVENAVSSVDGVGQVRVDLVFDPPWTPERMSEEAQVAVGWF
ncbi:MULTISPECIES: SUF system Fe-S cluster assembly protein [Aurantimonas]|jgi:FeS assembly SUF system protein|uniref:SUF system Fe-S cluster assembly protein n=1 Tax=Aurantimonas TaxID=182269 RepID=UPI000416341D|nr:SUF system Fe-S cluster assembly protein [Aurantimonas coralicida]MCC4299239.1 SUF system Fe-S cluster assembly protein [Aurantimonas coralicida]MCW7545379.1 SUF system Fe-S cluster assembly protein [Aurantimonas litoralis]MDE0925004.1 SUF system Fe-S cluster assembly protein [Aurantimonas coralicida]|tara:strand:- start:2000 stop:2413 length:414 start_codon:yes stop_codon:yes gene_type:complete